MRYIVYYSLLLLLASCGTKKQEERKASEPSEVAGGFGLTMQCSVLNRDAQSSESASIGCVVMNDDGTRYKGPISDTKAEIVTSSGQVIKSDKILSGVASGSYSFGGEVSGLKPSEATTIRITAKFDEGVRTLVASLKGRFTRSCDEDVTYFVRSKTENAAYEKNLFCTKDEPCDSIKKVFSLLPDNISCTITVDVGAGTFREQINVDIFTVTKNGQIVIQGSSTETTIIQPMNDSALAATDSAVINVEGLSGPNDMNTRYLGKLSLISLTMRSSGTQDASSYAIRASSSNVGLHNVTITGFQRGLGAINSSNLFIDRVRLLDVGNTGISINSSTMTITNRSPELIIAQLASEAVNKGFGPNSNYSLQIEGRSGVNLPLAGILTNTSRISLFNPQIIKISNFLQGINARNSQPAIVLRNSQSIVVDNTGVGIWLNGSDMLFQRATKLTVITDGEMSNVAKNNFNTSSPALTMTNIRRWGVLADKGSLFADYQIENQNCTGDQETDFCFAKKPSVIAISGTGTEFTSHFFSTVGSKVTLNQGTLSFCGDRQNGFESLIATLSGVIDISLSSNTFCSSMPEPRGRIWEYVSTGAPKSSCPESYILSGGQCYGGFGVIKAVYDKPEPQQDVEKYIGISATHSALPLP